MGEVPTAHDAHGYMRQLADSAMHASNPTSQISLADRFALVSIAESLREANVETRASEMTAARGRVFDEWAERALYDHAIQATNGIMPAGLQEDVANTIVERFRAELGIEE